MTVIDSPSEREVTAERLLAASARRSYDPELDIDWTSEMPADVYHWPPEKLSLYGTPMWDRLSAEQRVALSQQEAVSVASAGIFFEIVTLQLLARYVAGLPPTARHAQYALTEMADECRHIVMFARSVEWGGGEVHQPGRLTRMLSRTLAHVAWGPSRLAAILTAEDIMDMLNRATMADERVQPMVRQISRVHVVEEARHLQFAQQEVSRLLAGMHRPMREIHRMVVATATLVVARNLVSSAAYRAVGLSPRAARRAARRNPHHRETMRWASSRAVAYLREVGLIGGPSVLIWKAAGLL
jgi:hypothetical protein